MLVLHGHVLATFENERHNPTTGESWIERTLRVLVRSSFVDVRLSKSFDLDTLPPVGDPVSVEVSVQAYKSRNGDARYSFTGWRISDTVGRPAAAVAAPAGV